MKKIVRWWSVAAVCLLAVTVTFVPATATAQDAPELEDWQRQELQDLIDVVAAAIRGELVQVEDPFTLQTDFLKGTSGLTYVPFRVAIDQAALTQDSLAIYLFVTPQTDDQADEPEAGGDAGRPESTFEDAYFVDVSAARTDDGRLELTRAFTAPGGQYDVYLAVRESLGADADDASRESAAVMMARTELDVPDFWNDELQTSSVILAQAVEPLDAPLSPDEQAENPYTLGTTRIVPRADHDFATSDELSLIMLVYNASIGADQKPDLTIEYDFHQQTDSGEEYFNQTNPQEFNAETLPPGFDLSAGHQIVAGQSVPLASFPEGAYRLEITVTDNESGSSLIRDVEFSVSGE